MAKNEFVGKIKYLGDASCSQNFKAAVVSLSSKSGKLYLKTWLTCNPNRLYRWNEITGAESYIKGQRLVIRSPPKRPYWELHFMGDRPQTNQKLLDDIRSLSKGSSTPQNKAEVGCEKSSSPFNGLPFGMRPITHQEPPRQALAFYQGGQESSPHPGRQRHASGGQVQFPQTEDDDSGTSPRFTRVKENRRQSGEAKKNSDDESKENQHRGPVNVSMDPQNKQGDRKPLQVSKIRFYGAAAQERASLGEASSNTFFKVTKPRPVSGPIFSPRELMNTYSWNQNRKNTLSEAVKNDTPQLQLQGFANIGNTCYMNAILQSLLGLDTFSMDLHSLCKTHGRALTRQSLAVALTRLMLTKQRLNTSASKVEELLHSVKRAISTTAKRFIGSQQHDAHEFLCQVLDQLKEEVTKVTKPKPKEGSGEPAAEERESPKSAESPSGAATTPVGDGWLAQVCRTPPRPDQVLSSEKCVGSGGGKTPTSEPCMLIGWAGNGSPPSSLLVNPTCSNFEFEVVHSFQCVNCQEQIQKAEQFNDLSVDIPKPSSKLQGMTLSLQDALDIFFQKEEIDYRCEKCGHTKAEVTHKFAKLPRVLILHLKRYTYNQWNNKIQEKLQLPRYITLQDHCDTSTVPHLPYRVLAPYSPLKSPVLCSPVRQPSAATPDYKQRRRRLSQDENGAHKGHKKVRRSLYAEVHDESTTPADQTPRTFQNSLDSPVKLKDDSDKPKQEVITIDMEADDADLQRAIDLSLLEYNASHTNPDQASCAGSSEDNGNGSGNNNNNSDNDVPTTWQENSSADADAATDAVDGSEDESKVDVLSMSYEKQLELAIRRSLASCSPPADSGFESSENSLYQSETTDHDPRTDSGGTSGGSVFKKPVSGPRKDNRRRDTPEGSGSGGRNAADADCESGGSEMDIGLLGVRNFTTASDFLRDNDMREGSPDGVGGGRGGGGGGDLGQGQGHSFTSCRTPGKTGVVPEPVSTSIGSLGALSKAAIARGRRSDNVGVTEEGSSSSRQDLMLMTSEEEEGGGGGGEGVGRTGYSTPLSSPTWVENQGSTATSPQVVPTEPWTPEEEEQIAEAFQEDWADVYESVDVFKEGETGGGTEEKENMSPVAGSGRSQNDSDVAEAPLDKEAEARQLQHRLRQTEIEKGILPHSYRLVSIVSHHGQSSSCGHYVSDVFSIEKQTWLSFDDRRVEKTTESFVRTKRTTTGYIFFYLSKDIFDELENSRPGSSGKELIERS
ncbi:uncharacterized protein LOC143292129 isoform X2 [Babylonia areolata]|uniref:uncharacterized protein LOC143292129 isoform X2 n=1 Tax=Babylonia areolata TaxID=304850 RepID=UPI003FD301C5